MTTTTASSRPTLPIAIVALALGAFGIGLTEFVILGLLPDVAADLAVDEPTAGWLVSGYALAVAFGGVVLTASVTRLRRKRVLLGLIGLFIAGNLICALAPDYGTALAGRVVAALCHGAFFGIGAVVAADLVEPARRATAIATMFTGLTVANVLGVPLGTLLGQQLGWRATFWAITAIGVVALAAIALLVPGAGDRPAGAGVRAELGAFRSGQVWASMAITVFGFGGLFGAFTYMAFTLTDVSGFPSGAVPWLLVLFGVGMFAGNLLGGRAADRSIHRTLAGGLAALAAALALFGAAAGSRPAAVAAMLGLGALGFLPAAAYQMRIMQRAGRAPTLASGANIAAFNVGNALGAWLGGLTIDADLGYTGPIFAGAAMTVVALGIVLVADRRAAARASASATAPVTPSG